MHNNELKKCTIGQKWVVVKVLRYLYQDYYFFSTEMKLDNHSLVLTAFDIIPARYESKEMQKKPPPQNYPTLTFPYF